MAVYDQIRWVGVKPTVDTAQDPGKQVTVADTDTEILAANEDRTSFVLVVRGDNEVFVKFGTGATVAAFELEQGDILSCNDYIGAVHGIVTSGTCRIDVIEV